MFESSVLELRINVEPKQLDRLRQAIRIECDRRGVDVGHVALVEYVVDQLIAGSAPQRGRPLLVTFSLFADASLLMIRDPGEGGDCLDNHRKAILDAHAIRWSRVKGIEGDTLSVELARTERLLSAMRRSDSAGATDSPAAPRSRPLPFTYSGT